MTSKLAIPLLITLSFLLQACEEEVPEIVPQTRAIKTVTITELATGQQRRFSGRVQATDSSAISFEVSGKVQAVNVDLGDRVTSGQVLAVLDKAPYELNAQAAEAEVRNARALMEEKKLNYDRQKTLFDKDWVSKAALDQAVASFESAQSQLSFAVSKSNLAKRDLRLTSLLAPFDGTIAEKLIDPFVEVSAGQKLFEINAEGALEVAFDIPENLIAQVTPGMTVDIDLSSVASCPCKGRLTEIGTKAQTANAFPVTAGLTEPPNGIQPGMTATVNLRFESEGPEDVYMVPLAAIAAAETSGETRTGYVFIYDQETSTVKRSRIKVEGVTDNTVHISEGINAGDIVAVAGVSFLADGMKVKLMTP